MSSLCHFLFKAFQVTQPLPPLTELETMFFACFYMLLAFSFTDPSMDLDEMTLQSILPWMSMCFEKHPTMDDTQL